MVRYMASRPGKGGRVVEQWLAGPTPHDRPHARDQLYDLVPDARVGFLAEAALECRGGETNCVGTVVSFPGYLGAAALGRRVLPPRGGCRLGVMQMQMEDGWEGEWVRRRDVPRARKRSSEGMQMAFRRRMVTGGRARVLVCAVHGESGIVDGAGVL